MVKFEQKETEEEEEERKKIASLPIGITQEKDTTCSHHCYIIHCKRLAVGYVTVVWCVVLCRLVCSVLWHMYMHVVVWRWCGMM